MKLLYILPFILLAFRSFGQNTTTDKPSHAETRTSPEALAVYNEMTGELCYCITKTMRNDKPSTTWDSCFSVVFKKYNDTLKALGYDPATDVGRNKYLNEIKISRCQYLYSLMDKEREERDAGKLFLKEAYFLKTNFQTAKWRL